MNVSQTASNDLRCNECGAEDIIEDKKQGDTICRTCGLVISGVFIDMGSEWRIFGDEKKEKDPNRVGSPIHPLIQSSGGTIISKGLKGYNNMNERLLKLQNQGNAKQINRFLLSTFNKISFLLDKGMFPKNIKGKIEELFILYFDYLTLKSDGSRTKSKLSDKETEIIISALFYIVLRNEGNLRSYKEISIVTRIPKKKIGSRVRAIEKSFWGININKIKKNNSEIILRFCKKLNLSSEISRIVSQITHVIKDREGVYGRAESSIVAAAIYLALQSFPNDKNQSIREISLLTGISEPTIRSTYRATFPYKDEIVNCIRNVKSISGLEYDRVSFEKKSNYFLEPEKRK